MLLGKKNCPKFAGPFVKHANDREAIVVNGPMLDANGDRWVCRIRYINNGEEIWVFADDLQDYTRKPIKEE
jgi:hypothetical protein